MTDNTPGAPAVALRIVDHREQINGGTRTWHEIIADRPHNAQVCHCAEREDAEIILAALNTRPAAALPSEDVERVAIARCIAIAREVRDGFLSPEYATDQPLSSMMERFACDQVAQAIEIEFTPAEQEPQ